MQHNLAKLFDTFLKSKFAVGKGWLSKLPWDISGRGAAQNLKITTHFSAKLAQFIDIIFKSIFAFGGRLALKTSLGISPERVQHKT